jgi:hypothetical protein
MLFPNPLAFKGYVIESTSKMVDDCIKEHKALRSVVVALSKGR